MHICVLYKLYMTPSQPSFFSNFTRPFHVTRFHMRMCVMTSQRCSRASVSFIHNDAFVSHRIPRRGYFKLTKSKVAPVSVPDSVRSSGRCHAHGAQKLLSNLLTSRQDPHFGGHMPAHQCQTNVSLTRVLQRKYTTGVSKKLSDFVIRSIKKKRGNASSS